MSSSDHSSGRTDLNFTTVSTDKLRDRLNRMYDVMRSSSKVRGSSGLFEYLWDLKELALLEGRQTVQVPSAWIEELDLELTRFRCESSLGH